MKILLVRLSSMGDLVHTLPAVSDLAKACPDVQLHWLCEQSFADVARLHPFVQKIHTLSWRQWRKKFWQASVWQNIGHLRQRLQAEQYDWVLDSQGLIKSAVFARLVGQAVVGLDKNSARESLASCAYQRKIAVLKGRNAVWRNRQLFAQAFDYVFDETVIDFGARVPTVEVDCVLPEKYHVALHASSRDNKLWAVEHWLNYLTQLHEHDSYPVLLTWGNEAEYQRSQYLAQQLPFVQVCPRLNLLQASLVLQNAVSITGVDTGLLHLANALNRPLVGIYTATDPSQTGTYCNNWTSYLGNVNHIPSPDVVFQHMIHNLQNYEKAHSSQ